MMITHDDVHFVSVKKLQQLQPFFETIERKNPREMNIPDPEPIGFLFFRQGSALQDDQHGLEKRRIEPFHQIQNIFLSPPHRFKMAGDKNNCYSWKLTP